MFKKTCFLLGGLVLFPLTAFGYTLGETGDLVYTMENYLRQDVVMLRNIDGLDNRISDDHSTYVGIDYSIGFRAKSTVDGPELFLKLERNGPYDYDTPLWVHNTLMAGGSVIEEYRNDELLPQVEEFWADLPLGKNWRVKPGLFAYEVGDAFSLSGSYENYGIMFSRAERYDWRVYYCRPDLVYKNPLGPRIRQDEEQGIVYNHNASNFFATDLKVSTKKGYLWPYAGVLVDYTSPEKRDNLFTAPISKDYLGTAGIAWSLDDKLFSWKIEAARNFGKGESADERYKDVIHSGYFFFTDVDCHMGKLTPTFQFLLSSGNKATLDMARDQDDITSGKTAPSAASPP